MILKTLKRKFTRSPIVLTIESSKTNQRPQLRRSYIRVCWSPSQFTQEDPYDFRLDFQNLPFEAEVTKRNLAVCI